MKKTSKLLLLAATTIGLSSCGTLDHDKFVYLGHGVNTPDEQLYFDTNKNMFMLVDKKNGCFTGNYSGTCAAFTVEQAKSFRTNVLDKMLSIDKKIKKQSSQSGKIITEMEKAGITEAVKGLDVSGSKATVIKQIVVDKKIHYHLTQYNYNVAAALERSIVDNDGKLSLHNTYTISFPEISKKQKTILVPFTVDPNFLYNHMTLKAVEKAKTTQKNVIQDKKVAKKDVSKYFSDLVS